MQKHFIRFSFLIFCGALFPKLLVAWSFSSSTRFVFDSGGALATLPNTTEYTFLVNQIRDLNEKPPEPISPSIMIPHYKKEIEATDLKTKKPVFIKFTSYDFEFIGPLKVGDQIAASANNTRIFRIERSDMSTDFSDELVLKSKCEGALPCIEMDLDHGSAWNPTKLLKASPNEGTGSAVLSLRIRAKLESDDTEKFYTLAFTAYTDGISCTDFGQGKVAVLSIKNGNPVLLSDRGPIEVSDKSLSVGCEDCARFIDTKTKKATRIPTRTYDISTTELENTSLGQTPSLLYRSAGKCIAVMPSGSLEFAADSKCTPPLSKQSPLTEDALNKKYPWLKPEKEENAYEVKGSKLLFVLKLGSCT